MDYEQLVDLYVTCRFDPVNSLKINPHYHAELIKRGYADITYYSRDNSEFFTFTTPTTRYFIFMGSNEVKDWLYNVFFVKKVVPYAGTNPSIKVHAGFLDTYLKVRDEVLRYATRADLKSKSIVVCGHSLGSAIATFAALDIAYNITRRVECFITGTPRVGNKHFKRSYNTRVPATTRMTLGNDIIAQLPPRVFGFTHIATTYEHIGSKTSISIIKDHDITRYADYL